MKFHGYYCIHELDVILKHLNPPTGSKKDLFPDSSEVPLRVEIEDNRLDQEQNQGRKTDGCNTGGAQP